MDSIAACNEPENPLVNTGERRNLAYMDFDIYTAPPECTFGGTTLTPAEMMQEGLEKSSKVVSGPQEI